MPEFSAGTVYVQVLPSLDGWRKAVRDQLATMGDLKAHVTVEPVFDVADFQRQLNDKLRNLRASVTVRVDADTAAADAKLAAAERRAAALDGKAVGIQVDADTAAADAKLAATRRLAQSLNGYTATVNVNADDHGSFAGTATRMQRLILAITAGSGAIGGLAAGFIALASGAVVGAAGLGAVAIGATAIGSAMKAQTAATQQAGQTAAQEASQRLSAANQVLHAQDQILNAQEALKAAAAGVATAQRSASTAVRTALEGQVRAEEQLQAAQVSALRAQEAITAARRGAARSIEDLQNKVTDDALAQRQAVLDLTDAEAALQKIQDNPAATARQRTDAQLNFEQAKQHLTEISLSYQRSQVDAEAASKAGVDGSAQVVSAQDTIISSQRALRDAQQSAGESATKVSEARVNGALQVTQAQEQVVRSQRAVEQSQRTLIQAQVASAVQAQHQGEAHQKFADALDKLSPASLRLVSYLRSQSGEWQSLTKASEGFAPGVQRGLQELEPSFGAINDNVLTLSTSAGDFFHVVGKGLAGAQPFFDTIAASSQTLFPRFGETVNRAAGAVGTLVMDMLPLAPVALDAVDSISQLVKTWSPFIAQASGPLLHSLQDVIHNLDFLGPLLVAIAGPAGDLTTILVSGLRDGFQHLTPELGPLIQSLVDTVKVISPLIGSSGELAAVLAHEVTPIIVATNAVLTPIVAVIGDLVHVFALLPTPITGTVIAFMALNHESASINRVLAGVGTAITGIGVKAGDAAIRMGASATTAGTFASAGQRVGTAMSKMGTAIPIAGAALIGIGELFALHAEKAQQSKDATDRWAASLVAGGFAAQGTAARLDAMRQRAEEFAASGSRIGKVFAGALNQMADDTEKSATRQRDSMSNVELAQLQVNTAQRDYDTALRNFGPTAAVTVDAHGRLTVATEGVKRAQHDAAEATKSHTQRMQDQQDQILAMADAKNAAERSGLQLERARLRITESQMQAEQAHRDVGTAGTQRDRTVAQFGRGSPEAAQANLDYVTAQERAAQADLTAKEATLDLASAQSRYVASSRDAAVAAATASGASDTSAAAVRGNNDALIHLLQTQGTTLPLSMLSMVAGMSEADKAFYGLTTRVDTTGQTILSLPGAPGQPPVVITFVDNIDHIKQNMLDFKDWTTAYFNAPVTPGQTSPGVDPDRMLALGLSAAAAWRAPTPIPGPSPARRAGGGYIPGSGTGDTVPALLTPGEFVLSRPAVNRLGLSTVAAMHTAARQGYATGGLVRPLSFAAGGVTPAAVAGDGTALGWLGALVTTTQEITGAVDPLALALRQRLIPALQDTLSTSATLAASSATHWLMISSAVDTATSLITTTALPALRAGLSLVDAAVTNTTGTFGSQFAAIRGYTADPVRFALAGPFNSLVGAWNLIDTTFAVGKPLAPLAIPFAAGGTVTGGEPGKDSVLAYLMPGEFVLPVSMVDQIGTANLEAARRSALGGGGVEGLIPGFEAGGAVSKALLWASSQVGKPYIWGGVGPDGYDCTGLLSAVANVALGLSPYARRFTTADFAADRGAGGFLPGRGSAFVIGVSDSHAAGTLAGHNIESTTKNGVSGVRVDGDASGALDQQFTKGQFFLPEVGGTFVPGPSGGGSFSIAALLGDTFAATRDAIASIIPAFGANTLAAGASAEMSRMVDAVIGWAGGNLAGGLGAPGIGPVADQVRGVAARYGWGDGPQWAALSTLIDHESGWNPTAQNPTSTARGIFQFLDSTWASVGATKTDNPALQAEAGLRYIQGRYGDPLGAWNFWSSNHWYDDGGYLPPGLSLAYNGTSRPEPVLTSGQWQTMAGQSGGDFTGSLYLDSGELLGVVRGEINQATDAVGSSISRRTRM